MADLKTSNHREMEITVVAVGTGEQHRFPVTADLAVGDAVELLRDKLGLAGGDIRLVCDSIREDVEPYSRLDLGQYVEGGHCRELIWLLSVREE